MQTDISTAEDTVMPDVINRLQNLEEQVRRIHTKLQFDPGLPGFEFYIEANGKEIWSGLDLQTHYTRILEQHPNKELVINWRSSPVTLV